MLLKPSLALRVQWVNVNLETAADRNFFLALIIAVIALCAVNVKLYVARMALLLSEFSDNEVLDIEVFSSLS